MGQAPVPYLSFLQGGGHIHCVSRMLEHSCEANANHAGTVLSYHGFNPSLLHLLSFPAQRRTFSHLELNNPCRSSDVCYVCSTAHL